MTITGFNKFLKKYGVPQQTIHLSSLSGKRIAMDTATLIYMIHYGIVKRYCERLPMVWNNGWPSISDENLIHDFRKKCVAVIRKLESTGVVFIYVIEGGVPDAKDGTRKRRVANKQTTISRVNALRTQRDKGAEYIRMLPNAFYPDSKYHNVFKDAARECNQIVVCAKYEAEGVVGHLAQLGEADFAMCEDCDIVMYGCGRILRNLSLRDMTVAYYSLRDVLILTGLYRGGNQEEFNLAFNLLQLICIVTSNDYTDGVYGQGLNRVLSLVTSKNITDFATLCAQDERFKVVDYNGILNTLYNNRMID